MVHLNLSFVLLALSRVSDLSTLTISHAISLQGLQVESIISMESHYQFIRSAGNTYFIFVLMESHCWWVNLTTKKYQSHYICRFKVRGLGFTLHRYIKGAGAGLSVS